MNEGVKILLERMKTNPEEFDLNGRDGKWENLVYRYSDWLDEEDKIAFRNAMKQMRQEKFTQEIMKELLAPEDDSLGKPWYTTRTQGTGLAGATLGGSLTTSKPWVVGATLTANSNSLTLGTATLTDTKLHELLHMKAQLESERQKQKKHKTLFGKLFNYS